MKFITIRIPRDEAIKLEWLSCGICKHPLDSHTDAFDKLTYCSDCGCLTYREVCRYGQIIPNPKPAKTIEKLVRLTIRSTQGDDVYDELFEIIDRHFPKIAKEFE